VGSGGVGKTTTAAAIALWGALVGRRTAVLTIDPAKRLADCLGLTSCANEETSLSSETFAFYGLNSQGSLTAFGVDQKGAWDALIERYAPAPEIKERILHNRFYQGLSQTFAGSHEYMALDKLCTLAQQELSEVSVGQRSEPSLPSKQKYDLIVVDTPPTKHALDFLEAPQRLNHFLDRQVIKWFVRPSLSTGWATFSTANRTAGFLLRKIEEATGISALGEISDFFVSMQRMFEEFGERLTYVHDLLGGEETAFLLVICPEEEVLAEADELLAGLTRLGVMLKGVITNRVHNEWRGKTVLPEGVGEVEKWLQSALRPEWSKKIPTSWLAENFFAYQTLARGEALRLEHFRRGLPAGLPLVRIPHLLSAPSDIGGLLALHSYLFDGAEVKGLRHRKARTRKE
jgi:anion-transporting  ArsA/GET3 family ATPase